MWLGLKVNSLFACVTGDPSSSLSGYCDGCRMPPLLRSPTAALRHGQLGQFGASLWELLISAYVNLIHTRAKTCFIATNSSETLDRRVWLRSGFSHPAGLCEVSRWAESHGSHTADSRCWVTSCPRRVWESPNSQCICHNDAHLFSSRACLVFASKQFLVNSFRCEQSEVVFRRKARKQTNAQALLS